MTRERWIDDWLAMRTREDLLHGSTLIVPGTTEAERARLKVVAEMLWQRRLAEQGEHFDADRYYQQVAHDSLISLKRRLGDRRRITITLPERMFLRHEHVARGRRSACITRLLARGWLWQSAFEQVNLDEEVEGE